MSRGAQMSASLIRCCVCRVFPATSIIYDRGWYKPSCLTCWPKIDIPKHPQTNLPVSGELVNL